MHEIYNANTFAELLVTRSALMDYAIDEFYAPFGWMQNPYFDLREYADDMLICRYIGLMKGICSNGDMRGIS